MFRTLIFIFSLLFFSSNGFAWNTPIVSKMGASNKKWLWTGAGGDSLWTNGSNWCGTVRNGSCTGASSGPTTNASLIFDTTCTGYANCTPSGIPAGTLTLGGLHLMSGFTGTLAFGATNVSISNGGSILIESGTVSKSTGKITLTNGNFVMSGGTFTGGSGDINLFVTKAMFSGGSFTAPSGLFHITADVVDFTGLSSFTHSSGTLDLTTTGANTSFFPGAFIYWNFAIHGCNRAINLATDVTIDGDFTVSASGSPGCLTYLNNHNVVLRQGNYSKLYGLAGGSGGVMFTGSGQQTIDTSGAAAIDVHKIIVAQPMSGSVKLISSVSFNGWDDTATQGSVLPNGQTVYAYGGTYNSTALIWPQITLNGGNNNYTFTALSVTDIVLDGQTSGGSSNGGDVVVYRNVTANNNGVVGVFNLNLQGSTSCLINTSSTSTGYIPGLKINKTGGASISFSGTPIFTGPFVYNSGALTPPTLAQFGSPSWQTVTVNFGAITWNNVEFVQTNHYAFASDLNVAGDLTIGGTSTAAFGTSANAYFANVSGNVGFGTGSNGRTGYMPIKLNGINQTIDASNVTFGYLPGLTIASSGNVTFAGTLRAQNSFTYSSGTVAWSLGSVLILDIANNFTLQHNGMTFKDVQLLMTNSARFFTIAGGAMVIQGNFAVTSTSAASATGTIDIYGNVNFGGSGTLPAGTLNMNLKGSSSTFSRTSTSYPSGLLTIAKTAGQSVTLATNVALNTNQGVSITTGSLDLGGSTLTLTGSGNLTMAGGTTTKLSGGVLSIGGSSIPAGAYSGGTVIP